MTFDRRTSDWVLSNGIRIHAPGGVLGVANAGTLTAGADNVFYSNKMVVGDDERPLTTEERREIADDAMMARWDQWANYHA